MGGSNGGGRSEAPSLGQAALPFFSPAQKFEGAKNRSQSRARWPPAGGVARFSPFLGAKILSLAIPIEIGVIPTKGSYPGSLVLPFFACPALF